MGYNNRVKRGFTLIELIVFIAIFSIIVVSFITIFVSLVQVQSNQSAVASVNEESQYLIQQIQYYVSSARLIDMTQDVAGNIITLREYSSSQDPTYISPGISFIQATTTDGDGCCQTLTSTATFVSTTTAGDFIIVDAGTGNGTNATYATGTISDTQGNTFTLATSTLNPNASSSIYLYYAANIKGGTDTVTFAWTNPLIRAYQLAISEYSGIAKTNPLDQVNWSGSSVYPLNALTTGNVTTANASDMLYSFIFFGPPAFGIVPTVSSGWTLRAQNEDENIFIDSADDDISSIGTYSNTFSSLSSSFFGITQIAAFKAAPGIGGSSGAVYLTEGVNGSPQTLTSNKVTVSNLSFTRHYNLNSSSSPFGTDSVSYSFTMSASSSDGSTYSQTFQSSVPVLNPVPKIVMLQQASAVNNSVSMSAVSSTYYTNNETSSLLLAVVTNTTSSATTSLSDTAGNTWNLVASTSYPAYNEKLTVFDALNAKNSSNTVTASFGPGAGYATLNIYEYRGASTSSSFDASSTQLQPDTQTPSSGSANATSAVELLFGVTYNGNTSEIPSAGTGFTLESSSTASVGNVYVEDSTQYVTGPVAATWQYSATTPSSTALIVTFK